MHRRELRMLIVDDQQSLAEEIRRVFEQRNWRTDIAANVERALAMLNSENFDYELVILDMFLPANDQDGGTKLDSSLCKACIKRNLQVVHVSAHELEELSEHFENVHPPEKWPPLIPKRGGDFTRRLVTHVQHRMSERRVRGLYSAFLQTPPRESEWALRGRPDPHESSTTNLISELCTAIRDEWKNLHPVFREELVEYFAISENEDGSARLVEVR